MNKTDSTNRANSEALRQTEIRLEQQLQIAMAADQRAMNFCGLMAVAATVSGGLAFANPSFTSLMVATTALIAAAFFSALSCSPKAYWPGGGKYSEMSEFTSGAFSNEEAVRSLAERNDERITKNNRGLELGSNIFRLAQYLGAIGAVSAFWALVMLYGFGAPK